MIDGIPLVDAHLHPPHIDKIKFGPEVWKGGFPTDVDRVYDDRGVIVPERFDAYLAEQGVDVAVLLCEYSPLVTGIQPVEDLLPIVEYNPDRFRFLANVNPRLHAPVREELDRQLAF